MVQLGIMISNGGAHPADKWAEQATEAILALLEDNNPDDSSPGAVAARQAKRDLRPVLFGTLNGCFEKVKRDEGAHLRKIKTADEAHSHAWGGHDPEPYKAVMEVVNEALSKTPWAGHFAQPHVQAVLWSIVGQTMVDLMHIERRYHHDNLTGKGA